MKARFFTYLNLSGEFGKLDEELRRGVPTAVFGVSEPVKYLAAAAYGGNLLYVAADPLSARNAYEGISVLAGGDCALLAAKDDVILYKDALSKDALFKRLSGINAINKGAKVVVADVLSLMQLAPANLPRIVLKRGEETDYSLLPARLVQMGYTRGYSAEMQGCFAVRGDILDIYPVAAENPVRVDFFGDLVENIRPYEPTSGERLAVSESVEIIAATDVTFEKSELSKIQSALNGELKNFPDAKAYSRARAIVDDLKEKFSMGTPFAGASFVLPLLSCATTVFDLLPPETLIMFDECKTISDAAEGAYSEHAERVADLKKGGEAFGFSLSQLLTPDELYSRFSAFRSAAVQTFAVATKFFRPLSTFNFKTTPAPNYLNSIPQFVEDAKRWLEGGYRLLVFTGNSERKQKLCELLVGEYLPVCPVPDRAEALNGIAVSEEEFSHGVVLHDSKIVVIGSSDLYTKAVTKRLRRKRGDLFVSPEVGDYCVHEKHGIGRIAGTRKIETVSGIKEYIAIDYKGGDKLYVPVEQMDVLSKYVGEADPPLSRFGGADFERVKERVRQSIKKLAFDLKELYAERSAKKGFAFPRNEVMMSEFEDSFEYEETPDQLASIEEIKSDMCSDKVMDRLLVGDVGYGKTEVALRISVRSGGQAGGDNVPEHNTFRTALQNRRRAVFRVRFKGGKSQPL